jgi:hypothetical protein
MTARPVQKDFAPGAALHMNVASELICAGFEPGYPVARLMEFDPLWALHALTDTESERPIVHLGARLPNKTQSGDLRAVPIGLEAVIRKWRDGPRIPPHWYLRGRLEYGPERWFINRKAVDGCNVRVFLPVRRRDPGYIQFIPIGVNGQFAPDSDELRWASCPSPLPPRVKLPD